MLFKKRKAPDPIRDAETFEESLNRILEEVDDLLIDTTLQMLLSNQEKLERGLYNVS